MRGYKYRSGATSLKQRQFSCGPQTTKHDRSGQMSRHQGVGFLSSHKNSTTNVAGSMIAANKSSHQNSGNVSLLQSQKIMASQQLSQNSSSCNWKHQQHLSQSAHSQKALQANQKLQQSQEVSILLRSLNQRQIAENARTEQSNKQLAKMQVVNFLGPSQGVCVGVSNHKNSEAQTKNYLHARMFARNLGINTNNLGGASKVFTQSQPNTFTHSRQSLRNSSGQIPSAELQYHLMQQQSQQFDYIEDEQQFILDGDNERDQPIIQGHRVAMNFQQPQKLIPYVNQKRPKTKSQGSRNIGLQRDMPSPLCISQKEQSLMIQKQQLTNSQTSPANSPLGGMQPTSNRVIISNPTMSPKESSTDHELALMTPKSPKFNRIDNQDLLGHLFNENTAAGNILQESERKIGDKDYQGSQGGASTAHMQRTIAEKGENESESQHHNLNIAPTNHVKRVTVGIDQQSSTQSRQQVQHKLLSQPLPTELLGQGVTSMRNAGIAHTTTTTQLLPSSHRDHTIETQSAYGGGANNSNNVSQPMQRQLLQQRSKHINIMRDGPNTRNINFASAYEIQALGRSQDHHSKRIQHASSTKSKKTISMYNQTPRGPDSHLKAKYSQMDRDSTKAFSPQQFNLQYQRRGSGPQIDEGDPCDGRINGNQSQLTGQNLECIEEMKMQVDGEILNSDASPRTRIRLVKRQQKNGEDSMRFMTPPCHKNGPNEYNNTRHDPSTVCNSQVPPFEHQLVNTKKNAGLADILKIQVSNDWKNDHEAELQQHFSTLLCQKNDGYARPVHTAEHQSRPQYNLQVNGGYCEGVSSQNHLANTDGNVNISAILVQAKRDKALNAASYSSNADQLQSYSLSNFNHTQNNYSTSNPMMQTQTVNQSQIALSGAHQSQIIGSSFGGGADHHRSSVGQINFKKPVNKLVNNVAKAIGESVRRMQPRSLQRSAISRQDQLARQKDYQSTGGTGLTRNHEKLTRQSKSSYDGTRQRKAQAPIIQKNTLVHKIAKITMQSHSEITENQMLKDQLQQLAFEQQLSATHQQYQQQLLQHHQQQQYNTFAMSQDSVAVQQQTSTNAQLNGKYSASQAQNQQSTILNQDISVIKQENDYSIPKLDMQSLTPLNLQQQQPNLCQNNRRNPGNISLDYTGQQNTNASLGIDDPMAIKNFTLCQTQESSMEQRNQNGNNYQSTSQSPDQARFNRTTNIKIKEIEFPLQVSRKQITSVAKKPSHGRSSNHTNQLMRGRSNSPPSPRAGAIVVHSLGGDRQCMYQQHSKAKKQQIAGGQDENTGTQMTQKMIVTDMPFTLSTKNGTVVNELELKALMESANATDDDGNRMHQSPSMICSTARDQSPTEKARDLRQQIQSQENHKLQQSSKKTRQDAMIHHESYPTTIYDEKVEVNGAQTPTQQFQTAAFNLIEKSNKNVVNQGQQTNQGVQIIKGKISPQIRVLSESAMAPVYNFDINQRIPAHLLISTEVSNLEFNTAMVKSPKTVGTQKTLNTHSSIHDSQLQIANHQNKPDDKSNDPNLHRPFTGGFQGLRIQSQGVAQSQDYKQIASSKVNSKERFKNSKNNKDTSTAPLCTNSQSQTNQTAIDTTKEANVVSQSAAAQSQATRTQRPNKWLQDAIRRGKQQRKVNHRQTLALQQSSQTSQVQRQSASPPHTTSNECMSPNEIIFGDQTMMIVIKDPANMLGRVGASGKRRQSVTKGQAGGSTRKNLTQPQKGFIPCLSQMKALGTQISSPTESLGKQKLISAAIQTQTTSVINVSPHPQNRLTFLSDSDPEGTEEKSKEQNGNEKDLAPLILSPTTDQMIKIEHSRYDPNGNRTMPPEPESPNVIGAETVPITELDQYNNVNIQDTNNSLDEKAILKEMQNIQDYKSHFPQQGSSLNTSQNSIGPGSSLLKNNISQRVSHIEFKVLPSKLHKMLADTSCQQATRSGYILNKPLGASQMMMLGPANRDSSGKNRPLVGRLLTNNFECMDQFRYNQGKDRHHQHLSKSPHQRLKTAGGNSKIAKSLKHMISFRVQGERFASSSHESQEGGDFSDRKRQQKLIQDDGTADYDGEAVNVGLVIIDNDQAKNKTPSTGQIQIKQSKRTIDALSKLHSLVDEEQFCQDIIQTPNSENNNELASHRQIIQLDEPIAGGSFDYNEQLSIDDAQHLD